MKKEKEKREREIYFGSTMYSQSQYSYTVLYT